MGHPICIYVGADPAALDAACTKCVQSRGWIAPSCSTCPRSLQQRCWRPATVLTMAASISARRLQSGSTPTSVKLTTCPTRETHIFVRGNLQKDVQAGDESLPGQAPSISLEDNTKGLAAGYLPAPSANIINDFRYAYIRQGYASAGIGQGRLRVGTFPPAADGSRLGAPLVNVPLNTIDDNLSWTKGTHSITVGGNWRMIQNNTSNDTGSFGAAQAPIRHT